MKYRVVTETPVALDSMDHQVPGGTMMDNSRNARFNEKLFALKTHPRPLRVLDLGCAGGGFVKDMLDAGHQAVGIEGSDYSLLRKRAEWATIPNNLFTADITRPFSVECDEWPYPELAQPYAPPADGWYDAGFDVITAWEVMEHLAEDRLPRLIQNVLSHMAMGAIWVMSVSTQHGGHHVTVKRRDWWVDLFEDHGLDHDESLVAYFGDDWVRGPNQNAPESFHLILSRKESA